ncbi:9155_t:CDS:1, partial [Funneliformis geosporum]
EWNSDFNLEGHEIHPADNETAKWILSSLFKSSLESSSFLNLDEMFTNI